MVSCSTYYLSMHYDRSKGQLNQRWFGLHSVGRCEAVCCPWFLLLAYPGSLASGRLVADQAAEMQGVKLLHATLTAGLPLIQASYWTPAWLICVQTCKRWITDSKTLPNLMQVCSLHHFKQAPHVWPWKSFSSTSANEHRDLELVHDACFSLTFLSPIPFLMWSTLCAEQLTLSWSLKCKGEEIPSFRSRSERVTAGHYPHPLNSISLQTAVRALGQYPSVWLSKCWILTSVQSNMNTHTDPVFFLLMRASVSTKCENESKVWH